MNLQDIYRRQNRRVYRIAMLYLRNPQDAEDTVQNIFLKYMEKGIAFESEEHENAWFVTVTRNYCKDVLRTFWKRKVDLKQIPENSSREEETSGLSELLLKLPAKYREVLYLYYYEEYSVREMSQILHRKESTLQTQLAAARKKLKLEMEREDLAYDR